ncbi:uncharacterized protein LOC112127474 [Cimex lectularius]|uniref:RNase H type-1 domain-containing protein n=1 Tax=Cimex lectularius TaxID=79782 RepID=A0A8I6SS31_CIMLE|nr:uncharacterized protein LOC112127474 [Cimex lectularius]
MFYKSIIRSLLDFGLILYGQASRTELKKLVTFSNKCLRRIIGALPSTPITALSAEVCEPPLPVRLSKLAVNKIINLHHSGSFLLAKIAALTEAFLTEKHWLKNNSPPIVSAFLAVTPDIHSVHKSNISPTLKLDYPRATTSLTTIYLRDYSEYPPQIVNELFMADITTAVPGSQLIFTDGSLLEGQVGCAIYDPSAKVEKMFSLPSQASIFTAEMYALVCALEYIATLKGTRFAVVSDSMSSIKQLERFHPNSKCDYLVTRIVNIVCTLRHRHIQTAFCWCRGHCGIKGNDKVDQLAKRATTAGQYQDIKLPKTDAKRTLNKRLVEWRNWYNSGTAGNFYKSLHPELRSIPWFATSKFG